MDSSSGISGCNQRRGNTLGSTAEGVKTDYLFDNFDHTGYAQVLK
jgi:hypothetical protein